ncbi:paraquat-inducible protein B [Roseivivax marinus]|uniref:Paraquat-inducible protein B n=1 Tax=Roseivivax marinus TaxID=1379903 RepID=W4HJ72_9RHOB|nr:MlaD family protein [Roseivivax marinus]ETW12035.1 paraquat-inducible protein B [Roseivivax marinus]
MNDTPTDTDRPEDRGQPGPVPVEHERRSIWERVSIVWLIPIVALAIALGAAWRNYNDQGPVIEIAFENAAGITADETELRYRDIGVGVVEEVSFDAGLEHVVVSVRVEKSMAEYIDEDARFWVVRPEVSARGVSGLDTVLSGVYIQGAWDSEAGQQAYDFEGLSSEPLLGAAQEGVQFTLTSTQSLPTAKTPIVFKGVEVGMVDAGQIDPGGATVSAEAVIYADYTDLVSTSTRFWDVSGFSFSLGTGGARLNFDSFASLITGGVTFATLGSGGEPITEGVEYELFSDEEAARDDFLVEGEGEAVDVSFVFDENLSGLSAGAAVELGGLRVGEVSSLTGLVDSDRFGDNEVRLLVSARINPSRLGLNDDAGEDAFFDYLEDRIAEGLRAQLTNASIITGGLKIVLDEFPDASEAELQLDAEPFPLIPTAPAEVTDVQASAQGALQRVADLPIEEVMQSAIDLMNQATSFIGNDDLQETPGEVRGILTAIRGLTQSDTVQNIPTQVSDLLEQVQTSADRLNTVLAEIEEAETATTLTETVARIGTAAEELPGLLQQAETLLAGANEVPLQELSSEITALLQSTQTAVTTVEELIRSEDVQGVPTELRGLLSSARGVVDSEGVQGLPAEVTALLNELQATSASINSVVAEVEAQGTAETLTQAVASIGQAADRLPALLDEAQGVIGEAGDLPFDAIATQVSDLLRASQTLINQVEGLVADEDVQAVPAELRGILTSARGVVDSEAVRTLPTQVGDILTELDTTAQTLSRLLAQVEAEDAVGKVIRAVEDVEAAADGLPAIVEEARGIVEGAGEVQIDQLVAQVQELVTSADALISQESTRALPQELNEALASVQATLDELRAGGVVENANATLASARGAAQSIQSAAQTLPALSAQLQQLANQAGTTLGAYDEDAQFSRDTRAAIRQVTEAADAIERLARTIERNPNSLILGR